MSFLFASSSLPGSFRSLVAFVEVRRVAVQLVDIESKLKIKVARFKGNAVKKYNCVIKFLRLFLLFFDHCEYCQNSSSLMVLRNNLSSVNSSENLKTANSHLIPFCVFGFKA